MELNMELKEIIDQGKYYSYNGELFTKTFPKEWAINQMAGTGTECDNCLCYGFWNGVFCAYCLNCADNMYEDSRGGGLYGYLHEGECGDPDNKYAAANTYLKDIPLKEIGDQLIQDSCAIFNVSEEQCLVFRESKAVDFANTTSANSSDGQGYVVGTQLDTDETE